MSKVLLLVQGMGRVLRPLSGALKDLVTCGVQEAQKAKDSREVQKWLAAVALAALLWALAEGVI